MIYAGIVAGGTGSRMGADRPKQFIELKSKPILIHTVGRFLSVREIDRVYIAVHRDWLGRTEELIKQFFSEEGSAKVRLTEGGADRNASIFKLIEAIKADNGIKSGDILLTHDAVRPFVTEDVIKKNIETVRTLGVCTTAVPATDTVLCSEDGETITDTPDRSKLYQAQTPQSFEITDLLETYSALSDEQKQHLTDVCGIYSAAGRKIFIVKGEPSNIKLTTPFDLKIAEAILS